MGWRQESSSEHWPTLDKNFQMEEDIGVSQGGMTNQDEFAGLAVEPNRGHHHDLWEQY